MFDKLYCFEHFVLKIDSFLSKNCKVNCIVKLNNLDSWASIFSNLKMTILYEGEKN